MLQKTLHIIGFGSQGSAWAQCLKTSGWKVQVYLSQKGKSFQRALHLGFDPLLLEELPKNLQNHSYPHWIALLTPDTAIHSIYDRFISNSPNPVYLILAHGYAVYSG